MTPQATKHIWLGVPEDWSEIRQEAMGKCDSKCFVCGRRQRLTIHQIKSRSKSAWSKPRNLICLCNGCHNNVGGESWSYALRSKKTKNEENERNKVKKHGKESTKKCGHKIKMFNLKDGDFKFIGNRY